MISFIVPAHNEQAGIGRTLRAIHDSARVVGQPYEIIADDPFKELPEKFVNDRKSVTVSPRARLMFHG
jgi:hypothetical protein